MIILVALTFILISPALSVTVTDEATAACFKGCICVSSTVSCNNLNLTSLNLLDIAPTLPANTTELIVDYNNIDAIPIEHFPVLPFLVKISLRSNQMADISTTGLNTKFPSLKVLDLSRNKISELDQKEFSRLEELYLDNNKIRYLRKYTFNGMPMLEKLSISSNDLEYIDKLAFFNLTNLKSLNLAVNRITALKVGTFDSFSDNIGIKLNLSSNQLESIPFGLLSFEDVDLIDISENEIWSTDDKAFQTIFNVAININLQHNVLKTIPFFKSLASGEIKLAGNPLVCDCKLAARSKQFQVKFKGVCQHPLKQFGKSLESMTPEETCTYCDVFEPCLNEGKCISYSNDTFKCMCTSPYMGETCQHDPTELCSNISCPDNSVCYHNLNNNTYTCQCKDGYQGLDCNSMNNEGDRSRPKRIYIVFGSVLFGGVIVVLCLLCCWARKYRKHESYMVVPSERTNAYGAL